MRNQVNICHSHLPAEAIADSQSKSIWEATYCRAYWHIEVCTHALLNNLTPARPRRRRHVVAGAEPDRPHQLGYTAVGNIKTAITGSYHAISTEHVPRYLAEYRVPLRVGDRSVVRLIRQWPKVRTGGLTRSAFVVIGGSTAEPHEPEWRCTSDE